MANTVYLQPAYVLHTRPYRETSLLVSLFTRDYGRVDTIARGVRRLKSPLRGLLQPFQCLQVSWSGRTELVSLRDAELLSSQVTLSQQNLVIGFYLNEILMYALQAFDEHQNLFNYYHAIVGKLQQKCCNESELRIFEKKVLSELGFGLNLQIDTEGKQLDPDVFYDFHPESGLRAVAVRSHQNRYFLGKEILALENEDFSDPVNLQSAKRLMRFAMGHLLQHKPIRSRDMFIKGERV